MDIHLTQHAKEQAYLRYRFTAAKLLEFAQKAITQGYSINDAPNKKIKRYLEKKRNSEKDKI